MSPAAPRVTRRGAEVAVPRAAAPRIYAIADGDALGALQLPVAVAAMAEAGVEWIQVRAKRMSGAELHRAVAECCRRLAGSTVTLWVDDRADLAAMLPVQGVHLGQQDLPPAAARELLGEGCLIGASTHDLAQLAAADADPAVDVVALGPVHPTQSKVGADPVVGLATLREARRLTDKPLVAIGGIGEENLGAVLRAGADSVVVLSALCSGLPADEGAAVRSLEARCRRLLATAAAA